jgi:hypothetical protein
MQGAQVTAIRTVDRVPQGPIHRAAAAYYAQTAFLEVWRLFVGPDGEVEAYDINGFTSMGQFGSVAEAAACACVDAKMSRRYC